MNKFYKAICAIGIVCGLYGCSDWDDHYNGTNTSGGNNLTLWQQLKSEQQLSDFCEVLEETKIFRQHKKTPVSYAELLDGGQSFTVVAPVNGTFNKDSLLQLVQTAQGDSVVEKFFVLNHISRKLVSIPAKSDRMLLLNKKHVEIGSNCIEGVSITKSNIYTKNGVLHIAAQPLPYERSLFEMLCDIPEFSTIGAFIRKYDEDFFDADNSVSSGIIEGVPVYVDSVIIERNRFLDRVGYINAEDSMYWFIAPTTAAWQQAYDEAAKYFVYDKKVAKRDSIQQYWAHRALIDDAVFNMTDQLSVNDSLTSVQYVRRNVTNNKPIYHVFKKPFEAGGILSQATPVEASNGVLYQVSQWPFTPEQTYFRPIWSEAENMYYVTEDKLCSYNSRRIAGDSISDGGYLQIIPQKATSNWEMTFRLDNTLSGHYDICAIVLPRTITHKDQEFNPCKFKATINYVDTLGNSKTFNCGNTQFKTDPARVDTVVLAESFYLPACNYDNTELKVSVKLTCSILARENSKYSREMYLDCIYLRPRSDVSKD